MKILQSVRKVPGGMMVIPLLLGTTLNTFFPQFFEIGGFTEALFQTGATPILAVFLFCNGAQISLKEAGSSLGKGSALLISKLVVGGVIGIIVNYFFGITGLLGITPLAIIGAITNSNGGLYAALASEYGDASDVGAVSVISLNDGPFLTMMVLGATGIASVPFSALIATIIPIFIGFLLGNLDEDIAKFLAPGTEMIIPFFAFPLGAGLSFGQLFEAGVPGIILGLACVALSGIAGYYTFKLIRADNPQVGAAIGTTAGNAVGTPAALAAVDPALAGIAGIATAQIAAAIIVTAILCPLLVNFINNIEKRRNKTVVEANLGEK